MFSLIFALIFIFALGLVSFLLIAKASNFSKRLLWVGGLGVFFVTLTSYALVGNFLQLAQELDLAQEEQVNNNLVDDLKKRLQENPQDLAGWVFLAQSYEVLEQQANALATWEKAYELAPDNQEVLLSLAENLAKNNAGSYSNRAQALVATAYFIDENHPDALWQMGLVASQQGDLLAARNYWKQLYLQLEESQPEAVNLKNMLEKLEKLLDAN